MCSSLGRPTPTSRFGAATLPESSSPLSRRLSTPQGLPTPFSIESQTKLHHAHVPPGLTAAPPQRALRRRHHHAQPLPPRRLPQRQTAWIVHRFKRSDLGQQAHTHRSSLLILALGGGGPRHTSQSLRAWGRLPLQPYSIVPSFRLLSHGSIETSQCARGSVAASRRAAAADSHV